MKSIFCSCLFLCAVLFSEAQNNNKPPLVYVDKRGVMRWSDSKKEASFFGVNYTVPFAYGYRSNKSLGIDLKKEIDRDVYHFARLGLDAFRVHVWDTEITDSAGNLLANEHLDLYDYLLFKLEERNIKILFTPLAFWGNGYPEKDENTGSFSSMYNKEKVLRDPAAVKAQETYLQQVLKHVNPYTQKKYADDPNIIALEINNEPKHTGPKEEAGDYINRMVKAIKKSGWKKPVFYNISESPAYADVVANAKVDGVSFQWYPTGLVANHGIKGNFLPNVDRYKIPFGDTIVNFASKAKAVYEFDAGDVLQSYMYPAMARSFREAGFQWATQFAYDPLGTAYANTEYQTHYLNLAYTPSKAISLLIAAKAFHQLPRLKNFGKYPADTVFDAFRVSYEESLSEMNSKHEFYYSNTTQSTPVDAAALKHIAGVGSSPVVHYEGTGAYFLDEMAAGTWRLELMPDAVHIRDPFEKASLKKEVTRIQWQTHRMQIMLPGLQHGFQVKPINDGNEFHTIVSGNSFSIQPGVYIISTRENVFEPDAYQSKMGVTGMKEFVAPVSLSNEPAVMHIPFSEVSAGHSFDIAVTIAGIDSTGKAAVEIHNSSNQWKTIDLQRLSANDFVATVPAELAKAGLLHYRIIIQKANQEFFVFPGNHQGDPYAWDHTANETWQTFVASAQTAVTLFNANTDRNNLVIYNPDWKNNSIEYTLDEKPSQLLLKATMHQPVKGQVMGWQNEVAGKLAGRKTELAAFDKVVIRARSINDKPVKIKLTLISAAANAFSVYASTSREWKDIEIPLADFKKDSLLLLPRPYPAFLPLWFAASSSESLDVSRIEKLEASFGYDAIQVDEPSGIEIESILLKKN